MMLLQLRAEVHAAEGELWHAQQESERQEEEIQLKNGLISSDP